MPLENVNPQDADVIREALKRRGLAEGTLEGQGPVSDTPGMDIAAGQGVPPQEPTMPTDEVNQLGQGQVKAKSAEQVAVEGLANYLANKSQKNQATRAFS